MARRAGALLMAVTLLAAGGCAAPPRAVCDPSATTLSGRIAVTGGERGVYGGFRLSLSAGGGTFDMLSPLGQLVERAHWDAASAALGDGRDERTYASFEAMTAAALGLALPRAALQDWVRGRPTPALPYSTLPGGDFEQLGWTVHVVRENGRVHLLRASRGGDEPAQISLVIDAAEALDAGCTDTGSKR